MDNRDSPKQGYDFAGKDPGAVLTRDEFEHFDEGMKLKNKACSAEEVNFADAAQSVTAEFDMLLS